ncbi:hypothetical protein ACJX0J_018582, partial [Zea mays]
ITLFFFLHYRARRIVGAWIYHISSLSFAFTTLQTLALKKCDVRTYFDEICGKSTNITTAIQSDQIIAAPNLQMNINATTDLHGEQDNSSLMEMDKLLEIVLSESSNLYFYSILLRF